MVERDVFLVSLNSFVSATIAGSESQILRSMQKKRERSMLFAQKMGALESGCGNSIRELSYQSVADAACMVVIVGHRSFDWFVRFLSSCSALVLFCPF